MISISFRNYGEKDWENGFKIIKQIIGDLYTEHKFLIEKMDEIEIEKFNSIRRESDKGNWKNSLLNLTKYLYEYYGKKVVILIDEYDQPIIDSYVKGYYEEAIDFFKSFYGSVLKDNEYLELGVITGIFTSCKGKYFFRLKQFKSSYNFE